MVKLCGRCAVIRCEETEEARSRINMNAEFSRNGETKRNRKLLTNGGNVCADARLAHLGVLSGQTIFHTVEAGHEIRGLNDAQRGHLVEPDLDDTFQETGVIALLLYAKMFQISIVAKRKKKHENLRKM